MQSDWSRLVRGAGTTPCIALYQTLSLPLPRCGKVNVIMIIITIKCLPPPPSLNVTAFQHRFNTEALILLHFSLHIWYSLAFLAFYSGS